MTKTAPTKPNVPKPPGRASMSYASRLGTTMELPAPDNMKDDGLENLNFKVPAELKRSFKGTAVAHGISMRDLLEQSFRLWVREKQK